MGYISLIGPIQITKYGNGWLDWMNTSLATMASRFWIVSSKLSTFLRSCISFLPSSPSLDDDEDCDFGDAEESLLLAEFSKVARMATVWSMSFCSWMRSRSSFCDQSLNYNWIQFLFLNRLTLVQNLSEIRSKKSKIWFYLWPNMYIF